MCGGSGVFGVASLGKHLDHLFSHSYPEDESEDLSPSLTGMLRDLIPNSRILIYPEDESGDLSPSLAGMLRVRFPNLDSEVTSTQVSGKAVSSASSSKRLRLHYSVLILHLHYRFWHGASERHLILLLGINNFDWDQCFSMINFVILIR